MVFGKPQRKAVHMDIKQVYNEDVKATWKEIKCIAKGKELRR
jgi:hypothetical protein